MAGRRAYADEYAVRVNRAVELLVDSSPADAVRALQSEHALSERQARRYVNEALQCPEPIVVPERAAVFTVRLPESLIAAIRAAAAACGGVSLSETTAHALRVGLERSDGLGKRSGRGGAPR